MHQEIKSLDIREVYAAYFGQLNVWCSCFLIKCFFVSIFSLTTRFGKLILVMTRSRISGQLIGAVSRHPFFFVTSAPRRVAWRHHYRLNQGFSTFFLPFTPCQVLSSSWLLNVKRLVILKQQRKKFSITGEK